MREHRSITYFLGLCILVGELLLGAACQSSLGSPAPTPTLPPLAESPLSVPLLDYSPEVPVLPEFIHSVNTGWYGLIFQYDLHSIVWARLKWAILKQLDPTLIPEEGELAQHITFFIDDRPQAIEITYRPSLSGGAGLVNLYSEFTLEPGEYEAAVVVTLSSGATLEYRWPFTVVAELTWPGLPAGVYVSPLPESTISQAAYKNRSFVPPGYSASDGGGICLGVDTERVVMPGEILDCGDILNRISLVSVDGQAPIAKNAKVLGQCELVKIVGTDANGVVTEYPGPYANLLWAIDLPPGEHVVVGQLQRGSEAPQYFAWRFTIAED